MTTDEQIGRNLIALRGQLSQKDLADAMRGKGFKWSQSTVWSIEKGDRPLRLTEAESVADVLSRPVAVLLAHDGEELAHKWAQVVTEKYEQAILGLIEYDEAREELALALDNLPTHQQSEQMLKLAEWVTTGAAEVLEAYWDRARAERRASLARLDSNELASMPRATGNWSNLLNRTLEKKSLPDG